MFRFVIGESLLIFWDIMRVILVFLLICGISYFFDEVDELFA